MAFSEDSVSTTGGRGGSNWWSMDAEVKALLRRPHIAATRPTGRACAEAESGWDGDIGVRGDKLFVEVCETQERLDVLTFSWCWPVADDLDLRGVHSKIVRANNETQEVRRVHAESTFLDFGV
jgi:hypothetical protein